MTYRSHTGKTKTGETFEKFLGTKDYDEKLASFEKFLHASFCKYRHGIEPQHALTFLPAEEDCALRSLVKDEIQDSNGGVGELGDEDDKSGEEDGGPTGNAPKVAKLCGYLETREKNIAELKKRLAEIEEQFPMPEDLKREVKKAARKKKDRSDEPVVRRESPRNKDKT
jgi:hypothetical protein